MKLRSPLILGFALIAVQGFAQSSSDPTAVVESSGGSFYTTIFSSPGATSFTESSTSHASPVFPYNQIKSNGVVDLSLPGSNTDLGAVKLDWTAAFMAHPNQATALPGSFSFYGQDGSELLTYSYSAGQVTTTDGTHFRAINATLSGPAAAQYHLPTAVNIDFDVFNRVGLPGGAGQFSIGDSSFTTTAAVPEPLSVIGIGSLALVALVKRRKIKSN